MDDEIRKYVLDTAGLGVWCQDLPEGREARTEPAAELHGLPRDEPIQSFAALLAYVPAEDRAGIETAYDNARQGDVDRFEVEYRVVPPEGPVRWVEARGRVLRDSPDNSPRLLIVFGDVTVRRQAESALLCMRSDRLEAVGRLSGGIAHEFNNLLTIICGYAELILAGLAPGNPLREQVREVRDAGRRATQLTAQLLAFGQRSLLAPRVLDLNHFVREAADNLRHFAAPGVKVVTRLAPDLKKVRVDPIHFQQALLDLAARAGEAMPRGGQLTLATGNVEAASPGDPGAVVLELSDTGEGLSPEEQAHLFEPFHTEETGAVSRRLKLAAVHGFVEQSGGRIEVESLTPRGTTFRIYLPLAGERPSEPGGAAPGPAGDETILVVESEESVRGLLVRVLKSAGYRVLEAGDGREALTRASRHPDAIHLLIADLMIPGMGGRELAEYLVAARPDVKILYLASHPEDIPLRPEDAPAETPILPKPFAPGVLLTKLREVLDRAPSISGGRPAG